MWWSGENRTYTANIGAQARQVSRLRSLPPFLPLPWVSYAPLRTGRLGGVAWFAEAYKCGRGMESRIIPRVPADQDRRLAAALDEPPALNFRAVFCNLPV